MQTIRQQFSLRTAGHAYTGPSPLCYKSAKDRWPHSYRRITIRQ